MWWLCGEDRTYDNMENIAEGTDAAVIRMAKETQTRVASLEGNFNTMTNSIKSLADQQNFDRWIEPLCGSGVVAFNLQPQKGFILNLVIKN